MILLAPGPVKVHPEIMNAQLHEMITHRSVEFTVLYKDLVERLKSYYQCEEAYVITGSGALGIEALIANLVLPNEKVLALPNGEFGDKLAETASTYATTEIHKIDNGEGWTLEKAKPFIDSAKANVLAMTYNETSYGVRNHIKEILAYAKSKGMITIIDGVSAWPGTPFNFKEFQVDGFVTGSQKGIGAPPGMALIGLSKFAVSRYQSRDKIPAYYLNFKRHQKQYLKDHQTPNTPAVSLFFALQKAFDIMDRNGGLEGAIIRHAELSEYVRRKVQEFGFKLIPHKGHESVTVVGFYADSKEKAKAIKDRLWKEYKIKIVGSRGAYADTGLRISVMGHVTKDELDLCFAAMEKIFKS